MKFSNFLYEKENFDHLINSLKKECKPILDFYKKNNWKKLLFRGIPDYSEEIEKRKVRKNRQPFDTDEEIHEILNEYFIKKFNLPLRSISLFCSGNWDMADAYGDVFIIFPTGKFDCYWSEKIQDLWKELTNGPRGERYYVYSHPLWAQKEKWKFEFKTRNSQFDSEKSISEYLKDEEKNWYEKKDKLFGTLVDKYQKGSIEKAINFNGELMIVCDEYYMIGEKFFWSNVAKKLKI